MIYTYFNPNATYQSGLQMYDKNLTWQRKTLFFASYLQYCHKHPQIHFIINTRHIPHMIKLMTNKLQTFWMFIQSDTIASNAKTFASTSSQIIGLHTNEVIEVVIPAKKKRIKSKEFTIETLQCEKFEVTLIVLTH